MFKKWVKMDLFYIKIEDLIFGTPSDASESENREGGRGYLRPSPPPQIEIDKYYWKINSKKL